MAIDPITGLEQTQAPSTPVSVIDSTSGLQERAQDIANQQGVQAETLATQTENQGPGVLSTYDADKTKQTLDQTVNFKPATSYVDSALSTVSGQLNKLLSSDSPYIQQQELKAKEQSQGAGLQNSTIAAYAGRKAATEAALPIAQQDAQTYAQAQARQQTSEYNMETVQAEAIVSGAMLEQKASLERTTQNINNAFEARMAGLNQQGQTMINDLQNQYNVGLQNLDSINKKMLLELQLTAEQAQSVSTASSSIMQNYQISVENMLQDPDFLALGPAAVNNAVNQLQTLAGNSIKFIGASQGINMDAYVNAYLSPIYVR